MKESCESCKYWAFLVKYNGDNYKIGHCRRNAPVIMRTPNGDFTSYPEIYSNGWCGEYKPRDN